MRDCILVKLATSVSHASTVRDTPRLARSCMLASASLTVSAAASITDRPGDSDARVAASDTGLSGSGAPVNAHGRTQPKGGHAKQHNRAHTRPRECPHPAHIPVDAATSACRPRFRGSGEATARLAAAGMGTCARTASATRLLATRDDRRGA